jgi:HK97 gp10 family phage protein
VAAKGSIVVTGIKEIDSKLKTLEPKIQRKVLRQAMRSGMKLVFQEALQRVPVLTGLLKKNIKLRAMKRKRNRAGLLVQVKSDEGLVKVSKAGTRYWYPAAVEWGHGTVPPHPFMRPAYDIKGPEAKDKTMAELLEGTLREAKG